MDMFVHDVQYVPNIKGDGYKMIFHIIDENNHTNQISTEVIVLKQDSAEERVIKYMIEQSERKYGKTISD